MLNQRGAKVALAMNNINKSELKAKIKQKRKKLKKINIRT